MTRSTDTVADGTDSSKHSGAVSEPTPYQHHGGPPCDMFAAEMLGRYHQRRTATAVCRLAPRMQLLLSTVPRRRLIRRHRSFSCFPQASPGGKPCYVGPGGCSKQDVQRCFPSVPSCFPSLTQRRTSGSVCGHLVSIPGGGSAGSPIVCRRPARCHRRASGACGRAAPCCMQPPTLPIAHDYCVERTTCPMWHAPPVGDTVE